MIEVGIRQRNKIYGANQQGMMMMMVIMFLALLLTIPVMFQLSRTSFQNMRQQRVWKAQADQAARAGLSDTASWFNEQQKIVSMHMDPVAYPYADAAFDAQPPYTIDPSIGLVKEYALTEQTGLWARYEVPRQQVNYSTNPSAYNQFAVHDFTGRRIPNKQDGDGLVWYIPSIGYIYRPPFNPANVVAKSRVLMEIRRMILNTPPCALVVSSCSATNVVIGPKGHVTSSSTAIGYYNYYSAPAVDPTGELLGSVSSISAFGPLSTENYLSVTPLQLRYLADFDFDTTPNGLPYFSVVVIRSSATFMATNKLFGLGILYVDGDLTLTGDASTTHQFQGILYVTGNVIINCPTNIIGTLIIEKGSLSISAGAGSSSVIDYSNGAYTMIQICLANYREDRSTLFFYR